MASASPKLRSSRYARRVLVGSLALVIPLIIAGVLANALATGATLRLCINFFITVVVVLGLQMFTGNSGIVSWGNVAFVGVGAYVAAYLTVPLSIKEELFPALPSFVMQAELGLVPSVLVAIVAGAIVALVIGLPICRMKEVAMAMSTLGLLVIAHGVFSNWRSLTRGNEGVYALPSNVTIWSAVAAACIAAVAAVAFKHSRVGLRVQATREDPLAALASGVNVKRTRLIVWVASGAMSAGAGALWAQYNLAFAPSQFYWTQVFAALAMIVIGGLATVSGAVTGAAIITVVYEILRGVEEDGAFLGIGVPKVSGLAQMALAVITLLILIFRPEGLLGYRELEEWGASWLRRLRRGRSSLSAPDPSEEARPPAEDAGGQA
ncbi:MAG TPA: branched-chain amino acid ABC transporter permease [Thermoleophilia bacterium]|nr:branched-chain amino acid ABC transporter permease [Thermoleophilia bacterium]